METPLSKDTPVVCRRLRSKGAWVAYGEPVTWEAGYISTAIFWCLGTADVIGPDDGFVHPHVCVKGRDCFWNQPVRPLRKSRRKETYHTGNNKIKRSNKVAIVTGASRGIARAIAAI